MQMIPHRVLLSAAVFSFLTMVLAPRTLAALRAYEGFDYAADTEVSVANDLNGGFGWGTAWQSTTPGGFGNGPGLSFIVTNSLSYTDSAGNVLVTTGNKILNTGTNGNQTSRPWRPLSNLFSAAGTTNWISFVGVRLNPSGGQLDRGANLTIFNLTNYTIQPLELPLLTDANGGFVDPDGNGRLAMGESSGTSGFPTNDLWTLTPNGQGSQRRFSNVPFTNLALFVVRIEHYNDGDEHQVTTNDSDNAYAWINPPNLSVEPNVSLAFTNILRTQASQPPPYFFDMAFDAFVLFAENAGGNGPAAEWYVDEIRVGDTYADVVPFVSGGSFQPRFTLVQRVGNSISLTLTGAVSTVYTILGSTNVVAPIADVLGTTTTDGTGIGTFTDTNALNSQTRRFYRAQQ